jgi:hypothetical protein
MKEEKKLPKKHPIRSYVDYRRRKRHLKHVLCLLIPLGLVFLTVLLISSAGIQITPEGQMLLFSTDTAGLEENLSKGVISEDLKKTFEDEVFPLSENASIINKTEEWAVTRKIVIGEESKKIFNVSNETEEWKIRNEGKIYTIKKEDGKLNVYGKIIRARYVIAIIFLTYIIVLILTFLYIPINYYFTKVEVNRHIIWDKIKKAIYISTCIVVIALLVSTLLSFWYDFVLQF